jgi:hypothetical protein
VTPFRVLSWGCGLQSTALAAMSALGEIERVDAIIHVDLHWERRRTVATRDWYTRWLREQGMYVEIIDGGDIREQGARAHIHMPFWTSNGGPLQRQCTRHFKVTPAKRRVRELIGFHPTKPPHPKPGAVEQWIGFTLDEWERIKGSGVKFIVNRWPLIERRLTRNDCTNWLDAHGLPAPPKSGCIGCPYTSASDWLKMREEEPESWREAVAFDEQNRHNPLAERAGSTADEIYVWRGVEPLAEVDLEAAARRERKAKQLPAMICNEAGCMT